MKKISLLFSFLFFASLGLFAQSWEQISENQLLTLAEEEPQIRATEALYFQLNFEEIYSTLQNAEGPTEISLPTTSGGFIILRLEENETMAPGLKENYPGIKTYNAMPLVYGNTWGKVEIGPKGIRAMIYSPGEYTLYIDPVFRSSSTEYIVYEHDKFVTDKEFSCGVDGDHDHNHSHNNLAKAGDPYNVCEMKTYRMAVAATGEYTQYHGGVEEALAAIATSINRMNGLYGRDFGVQLTLVDNNDEVIFTDPSTDPYGGNLGEDINENQEQLDNIIGDLNYDVGHLFDGTNNGGLAQVGAICLDGVDGRAATTSFPPVGDPFDIRVFSHELGHQFGARHSYNNSCNNNRSDDWAFEPGSGSTPMSYAAICAPNVQNFTDDYFHGSSMEQIGPRIDDPPFNQACEVTTEIDNTSPIIDELPDLVFIPISTPFSLAANATDLDGDTLTYCWEQMDNEITTQPPLANATGGPNFRSFPPTEDSVRYFPNLASLVLGGPYTWERIPNVERQMNFRVTVRDNAPVVGCTQFAELTVQTVGEAGPFEVLYPSDFGIVWQPFTEETVLWDVANTDASPINAETVNIWLSTNNGFGFQILLAEDVPNTGSYTLEVPNVQTSIAKIMIQNSEGTFFDVSNQNFDIIGFEDGFFFQTDFQGAQVCPDESFSFDVDLVEVGDYSEDVQLSISDQPENSDISLSIDQAGVGDSFTVTVNDLSSTPTGTYFLTVTGVGENFENELTVPISIQNDSPLISELLFPENEAEAVPVSTTLEWLPTSEPGVTYNVELASDESFSNIIVNAFDLTETSIDVDGLNADTQYFWRVSNQNECASSDFSEAFTFKTFVCLDNESDNVPVEIDDSSPDFYYSELEVDGAGTVGEMSVLLEGTHESISELIFRLESPDGTQVTLASNICGLNLILQPNGDVEVVSPAGIAGVYPSSGPADWAGTIPSSGLFSVAVVPEDLGADGDINDLCQDALMPELLEGNIALINRSEFCSFQAQVLNAQQADAAAAIVINFEGQGIEEMEGDADNIDIPAVLISYEDGQTLLNSVDEDAADFFIRFDDSAEEGAPCPPTDGGTYQPLEPLSAFQGTQAQGTWTLEIEDTRDDLGGELIDWSIDICYELGSVVSTQEELASEVVVFPNPTSNNVIVELGDYKADRALLMDLSGRLLETKAIQNSRIEFNLSNYATGFYFIRLEGDNAGAIFKIIKQD